MNKTETHARYGYKIQNENKQNKRNNTKKDAQHQK